MLWSSNLEVLLLTTRATNAEKNQIAAPLENFGWALFGIRNMSNCSDCALRTAVSHVIAVLKRRRSLASFDDIRA